MYIEGIYLNTEVDSTFDNMMSSIADYTGSVETGSAKEFLTALALAVERSKVVMALGPLSGKNGLINIMSKGLSLPMAEVDWDSMGVAPIIDTLLPKGAVPLLSSDDRLVGMILESGNQSIIVLSDDAEMRAEMLETYIEPYIGAKSIESDEQPQTEDTDSSDMPDTDYDTLYSGQDYDEALPEYDELIPEEIDESPYFDENDPNAILDELFDNKADGNRIGFIEEEDFVLEEEPKKVKKAKKSKKLLIPIIAFLLIAAIIGGYFIYDGYYMPSKCRDDYATLRMYKDETGDSDLLQANGIVQYGKLYEINNDMMGWLSIAGTGIDYPVVSAAEKGDKYYRTHTFSGVYGSYGTPYIKDEYSLHSAYPLKLAVFGNNTGDGQMFSNIEKYLDIEYYKAHPVITMNSILYDDTWKIVSVMPMDKSLTTAAVDYTYSYAEESAISKDYITALRTYSFINCVDTADTEDHLLTLIAPYSKDSDINIVVTARRVRDNESSDTDTSSASYNNTAKMSNAITAAVGENADYETCLSYFLGGINDKSDKNTKTVTMETYRSVIASARSYVSELGEESILYSGIINDPENTARDAITDTNANSDIQVITVTRPTVTASKPTSSTTKVESNTDTHKENSSNASSSDVTSESTSVPDSSSSLSSVPDSSSSLSSSKESSSAEKPEKDVLYYDPNYKTGITIYAKGSGGSVYGGDAMTIVSEIVEAEMGSRYSVEALKAQAVATFSYLVYHGGLKESQAVYAPMKDASLIVKAATQSVIGEIMKYNGKTINAVYSATSADYTADAKDIWGSKIPYLVPVSSPYDYEGSKYKKVVTYTKDELKKKIEKTYDISLEGIDAK